MEYKKIYCSLCNKAKLETEKRLVEKKNKGVYYEGHHIIPKCEGGLGNYGNYNHKNIVLLTPKEHYIAHLLLCEIYPSSKKLKYALFAMCNQKSKSNIRYKPSSTLYERLKKEYIEIQKSTPKTKEHIQKIIEAINTQEVKNKKSKKLKNIPKTKEHKEKLKNRWKNPETRESIINSMKKAYENPEIKENRKKSAFMANEKIKSTPDVTCEYCGKVGKRAYLSQFHFENCKHKNTN